jgi:hypothetical protein
MPSSEQLRTSMAPSKRCKHREEERIRREELLMSLLQDLRQVISDTGALGKDTVQDRRNEQRLDPSSG